MKFEIKNRWTGSVIFTAEITCDEDAGYGIKLGLAVKAAIEVDADLSGANLSDADLSGANLSGANLSGANLSGANLSDANLSDANLRRANLSDADLSGADLSGANLRRANLRRANLSGANLRRANLRRANLSGAGVGGNKCDLSSLGIKVDSQLPHKVLAAIESGDGELQMENWHTCETSHCLAGWAVHLSGPAGYALEAVTSSSVAGAILMPDAAHLFYKTNEEALEWLKEYCAKDGEAKQEPIAS